MTSRSFGYHINRGIWNLESGTVSVDFALEKRQTDNKDIVSLVRFKVDWSVRYLIKY